jgi:hypothetical protein
MAAVCAQPQFTAVLHDTGDAMLRQQNITAHMHNFEKQESSRHSSSWYS